MHLTRTRVCWAQVEGSPAATTCRVERTRPNWVLAGEVKEATHASSMERLLEELGLKNARDSSLVRRIHQPNQERRFSACVRAFLIIAAVAATALVVAAGSALAANGIKSSVIFDSSTPERLEDEPAQLRADGVLLRHDRRQDQPLRGTARSLNNVSVTLSSWACQTGSWNGKRPCLTQPGATSLAADHARRSSDDAGPRVGDVDEELRHSFPAVGQPQAATAQDVLESG